MFAIIAFGAGPFLFKNDGATVFFERRFLDCGNGGVSRSRLLVSQVGLNKTRSGILDVLIRMGAQIRERIDESGCEPMGSIEVKGGELQGIEIGGDQIPTLIDEVPILAVAGAMAKGRTVIRDAAELRAKESDRIASTCDMVRRLGGGAEPSADGFEIVGLGWLDGGVVDSCGDHRIAMAAAVAATASRGTVTIEGAEVAAVSWPDFYETLEAVWSSR